MSEPQDQGARLRVRDDHGCSLFVEAGAGTGKTSAIVSRVVALVASGVVELRDVAAITFTEAAAAELRDRIRHQLERATDGGDDSVLDAAARARCATALAQIDDAGLGTLHGFAQRVLAEHPLEAGLPPAFEVMDDIRARIAFDQRWQAFVDDCYADEALAPLLLRGLVLGLGPDHLRDVARTLDDHHDRVTLRAVTGEVPPLDTRSIVDALEAVLQLGQHCRDATDRLLGHLQALAPWAQRLREARDDLDELEVLRELPSAPGRAGRAGSWRVDIDEVRRALTRFDALVAAALTTQRTAVLDALVARVLRFTREAAGARRRAGTLEFHDLLVLTRDLLRADDEVRAAVAGRWRCLVLDEFQDTDPLQIEIATLLATDDPEAGAKPWCEITVRPGALVVVGDPKQSIYRFRRADLGVYHQARDGLGLERLHLSESFRAVPGIVDFVDHVHAQLLVEELGVQAGHEPLRPHRVATGEHLPVRVFGAVSDDGVAALRTTEAGEVAALVTRIKDEEWLVSDPDGTTRPARYEDVALLLPSRTVLPALEDALEAAGIPVRVESQSLIFSTAEVRDLLAALSAVDDPTDEIAVVAALRSPAFGCSDRDLVEFVRHGGRWDLRLDPPESLEPDHPVVTGLAALRSLWDQRWWRSVSQTLDALVRERRVLELCLARQRPRDHWRRIRYLQDQARAWDDAGGSSLRDFVEWVNHQADERARVLESVVPEPDDDAVRILTVHGAKGLEFPIVVLAGLNTIPPRPVRGVVWTETGAEFGFGTKRARTWTTTSGYEAALKVEESQDAAERLRLLYVAMTRARDHLVVSLHHKDRSDCHAAAIARCLDGAVYEELALDARVPSPPAAPLGPEPASADPDRRAEWVARRSAALVAGARPSTIAVTTLAKATTVLPLDAAPVPALDVDPEPEADRDERTPWRRGRAGTAIGRAVHAVLQSVDAGTGAGLDALARAQATAEQVPGDAEEIVALARAVLASPVVRTTTEPGVRSWREVPVAAAVEGVLVEGYVDLLLERDGELVVVDYKTDRLPGDADVDGAVVRYAPQAAAYALVLETVLDRRVDRAVLVFARTDGAVEREVPDLPAAIAAVRGQLRERAGSVARSTRSG